LEPLASSFKARAHDQQLTAALADIVRSLAHMHVNRSMLSNPREHEMIIYAFLGRAYRSKIARAADVTRILEPREGAHQLDRPGVEAFAPSDRQTRGH